MARNPRYDILFEPIRIGPVTAPNRFYQTPHATGMGHAKPESSAALRGIKAEGGWGVVCTEYCSIHPSSDDSPFAYLRLWNDQDICALANTANAIHAHGSLSGIELWHGGSHALNRATREPALAPSARAHAFVQPAQARAMDKADITELRNWQKQAAIRAKTAGFNIIYVYAGHDYLPFQFLSRITNQRTDEYGGATVNRARLLREMIEDTKEAVGDTCAVAVRLAVDELHGASGITCEDEGREIVELLAELPDLWDINVAGHLGNDSKSSRFSAEGFQEEYVSFVKTITTRPVVSVGRFTSPDRMVDQIKRGVQDFIGAARPSIADPFLPRKVDEGREDEIRECIGCNICRSANNEGVPMRCTQNPTMGEEWRRGWHPEIIARKKSEARILVVGSGPAGLEATLSLGQRGYSVALAEATRELGGRVVNESKLPGFSNWIRVRDYRAHMIDKLSNIDVYRESRLTAQDIKVFDADHVVIATGSKWLKNGAGTLSEKISIIDSNARPYTPDDVFSGVQITGPVTIYDDEHYFMGGALAEKFVKEGHQVTLVTPHSIVSAWTEMTDEQFFIQKQLLELGVTVIVSKNLGRLSAEHAVFRCVYTGKETTIAHSNIVLVTGRYPHEDLYDEIISDAEFPENMGVTRIGDCLVPSSIADAVHSGHKYARHFEESKSCTNIRREQTEYFNNWDM